MPITKSSKIKVLILTGGLGSGFLKETTLKPKFIVEISGNSTLNNETLNVGC